jgi:menaquinone-dependent protoporphyrinogen oxidase
VHHNRRVALHPDGILLETTREAKGTGNAMAQLAVLYSSGTGQTLKIATRIADWLRAAGHAVELQDARHPPAPERLAKLEGVVLGSWVRGGRHMHSVRRFVERNRALLGRVPSGFFSVSLLQRSHREGSRVRAAEYVPRFVKQTGWQPGLTASFAGAIRYTQFGWLGRRIERSIWRREGIDTDITRDHEYTRWEDVEEFAEGFARMLPPPRPSG